MDGVEITYFVWCNICTHRHDIFSCIHTFNHFSTEHYVQYDMCMDTIFLCSKWWYELYLFAKYLSVLSKRQQELEGAPESTELICCPSFVPLTQQRQPGFKIGTLSVQLYMIHIKIQRYTHIYAYKQLWVSRIVHFTQIELKGICCWKRCCERNDLLSLLHNSGISGV